MPFSWLSILLKHRPPSQSFFFSDSRSAIHALGHYDSTHPLIAEIVAQLRRLQLSHKTFSLCWVPSHVSVAGNEAADVGARNAAHFRMPPFNRRLSYSDYYPLIKAACRSFWSSQWTAIENNKLRLIKPDVHIWQSSCHANRQYSRLLTRLRIGHTLLSQGYLMKRGTVPYCEG